ncbi:hypothetical protein KAX97_13615 [candidate division WOR-3 bacterium]|nr:hypothetical protein [candidate division WOR-3 bacterium]
MAKKRKKEKDKKKEQKHEVLLDTKFSKKNTMFFGIGLILLIIGFVLLAAGDITLAPILLAVGYLVFFPLGILLK